MIGKYYIDYYKLTEQNIICIIQQHLSPYLQFIEGWSALSILCLGGN